MILPRLSRVADDTCVKSLFGLDLVDRQRDLLPEHVLEILHVLLDCGDAVAGGGRQSDGSEARVVLVVAVDKAATIDDGALEAFGLLDGGDEHSLEAGVHSKEVALMHDEKRKWLLGATGLHAIEDHIGERFRQQVKGDDVFAGAVGRRLRDDDCDKSLALVLHEAECIDLVLVALDALLEDGREGLEAVRVTTEGVLGELLVDVDDEGILRIAEAVDLQIGWLLGLEGQQIFGGGLLWDKLIAGGAGVKFCDGRFRDVQAVFEGDLR